MYYYICSVVVFLSFFGDFVMTSEAQLVSTDDVVSKCYNIRDNSYCFGWLTTGVSGLMTWGEAQHVCQGLHSTLLTVTDNDIQDAVSEFLSYVEVMTDNVWLAARRYQSTTLTWVSGVPYTNATVVIRNKRVPAVSNNKSEPEPTGIASITTAVAPQSLSNIEDYAAPFVSGQEVVGYLKVSSNSISLFATSIPYTSRRYICQYFDETTETCSERCDIKNVDCFFDTMTSTCLVRSLRGQCGWYRARSACLDKDGDLAVFDNTRQLPSGSVASWLSEDIQTGDEYWIGLTTNSWIWNDTDSGIPLRFTYFQSGQPSNLNNTCMAMDFDQQWAWSDWSCDQRAQVVCQQVIQQQPLPADNQTCMSHGALGGALVAFGALYCITIVLIWIIVRRWHKKQMKSNTPPPHILPSQISVQQAYNRFDTVRYIQSTERPNIAMPSSDVNQVQREVLSYSESMFARQNPTEDLEVPHTYVNDACANDAQNGDDDDDVYTDVCAPTTSNVFRFPDNAQNDGEFSNTISKTAGYTRPSFSNLC